MIHFVYKWTYLIFTRPNNHISTGVPHGKSSRLFSNVNFSILIFSISLHGSMFIEASNDCPILSTLIQHWTLLHDSVMWHTVLSGSDGSVVVNEVQSVKYNCNDKFMERSIAKPDLDKPWINKTFKKVTI